MEKHDKRSYLELARNNMELIRQQLNYIEIAVLDCPEQYPESVIEQLYNKIYKAFDCIR